MAIDYKARAKAQAIARDKQFARQNPGLTELRRLIKEFDKFPADLRKELRPKLKRAGATALADARTNAAWSKRIPKATRLSISFSKRRAGLKIQTNKNPAPHARPMEHRGRPGWFRHPLFGRPKKWVRQRARPFLWPAAKPLMAGVDADIGAAADEAARKHGFK